MGISQNSNLSAKATRVSDKVQIYQPKQHGYQTKFKFISQSNPDISQSSNLSAKTAGVSAKIQIYQPKQHGYQTKFKFISQNNPGIRQSSNLSAKATRVSDKVQIYQPKQHGYQTNSLLCSHFSSNKKELLDKRKSAFSNSSFVYAIKNIAPCNDQLKLSTDFHY
ncbi:hypothetical protein [Niallia circulans]|uniref:hypothetical protein n=1 Tax=Niallia circulans TaxID=1397 RepID=UPI00201DE052|nr:hypothetical protein [Niallia circulans]